MKRKALTNRQRFEVFKRDSFTCQYCGKSAPDVVLNVDHIIPVNSGGDSNITNLVTSCFSCNSGKSDKELSDDSAVKMQMNQLELIQNKKEQVDMIAEWAMLLNKDFEIEAINKMISNINQSSLTEFGIKNVKKLISKYGFKKVAESIPLSYQKFGDDYINKLSKYINMMDASDEDRHFMYSIGILKNRLHWYDKHKSAIMIKKARSYGLDKDAFRSMSLSVKNWTEYREWMEYFICNAEYHGVQEVL
jgi:hypothetical protein